VPEDQEVGPHKSHRGKQLNGPNDLVIDARGRIWFTDPRYGVGPEIEQDAEAVYRIDDPNASAGQDPNDTVVRVLGPGDVQKPNGIAISPDQRTLYVADNDPRPNGPRQLLAFSIGDDGRLAERRVIYDFGAKAGPDGLRVDITGLVYAAAGSVDDGNAGVYIFDPGDYAPALQRIQTPETPSNLAFGGPDGRTLYITASHSLYSVRTGHPGYVVYPRWER